MAGQPLATTNYQACKTGFHFNFILWASKDHWSMAQLTVGCSQLD